MLNALFKAIGQLDDRRILGVLGWSVLLGVVLFALLWTGVAWALAGTAITEIGWIDTVLDVLGGIATLLLTWLLFPVVLTALIGLFLERVAGAVERRHYADLPPAPGLPFLPGLAATLRFLGVAIALNVALLPLLLFPPAYAAAYYLGNGYLVGREYFELVALRRLDPASARALRKRHSGELLLAGAGMAFVLTVPFANLFAPIVLTAAMVHRFEDWRRAAGRAPALPAR